MYSLRSGVRPLPAVATHPGYQPGYQNATPPAANVSAVTATLEALYPLIDSLKPSTDFEIGITNVVRLLVGQLAEVKREQDKMQQHTDHSFQGISSGMLDLTRSTVKTEQYNRRDTATVTGLVKADGENDESLHRAVADVMSAAYVA